MDDEPAVRFLYRVFLQATGYEVIEAANGVEALELLQHRPLPSLILLDLNMPRMSGFGFYARFRKNPELFRIPVILSSGDPSLDDIAGALGVTAHVPKGDSEEHFLSIVTETLAGTN